MNAIITPSASQKDEIVSIPYDTYKIEIFKIPKETKIFRRNTSDVFTVYVDYFDSGTVHGWLMNSTTSDYGQYALFSYIYVALNDGTVRDARMNSVSITSYGLCISTYIRLFTDSDTATKGVLNRDLILWRQMPT